MFADEYIVKVSKLMLEQVENLSRPITIVGVRTMLKVTMRKNHKADDFRAQFYITVEEQMILRFF